jgi:hypothetical protein
MKEKKAKTEKTRTETVVLKATKSNQAQELERKQWKRMGSRNVFADNFWKRFSGYIEQRGDRLTTLGRFLGLSPAYFGAAIRNHSIIGIDVFNMILDVYPELNPEWLLTGRGLQFRGGSVGDNEQNNTLLEITEKKRLEMLKTLGKMKTLVERMEGLQTSFSATELSED